MHAAASLLGALLLLASSAPSLGASAISEVYNVTTLSEYQYILPAEPEPMCFHASSIIEQSDKDGDGLVGSRMITFGGWQIVSIIEDIVVGRRVSSPIVVPENRVWVLNLQGSPWRWNAVERSSSQAVWPQPRAMHVGEMLIVDSAQQFVIFGGCGALNMAPILEGSELGGKASIAPLADARDVYLLNTKTEEWTVIHADNSFPETRMGATSAVHANHLFMHGGCTDFDVRLISARLAFLCRSGIRNDLWAFSGNTKRWFSIRITGDRPSLYNSMSAFFGDKLSLISGYFGVFDGVPDDNFLEVIANTTSLDIYELSINLDGYTAASKRIDVVTYDYSGTSSPGTPQFIERGAATSLPGGLIAVTGSLLGFWSFSGEAVRASTWIYDSKGGVFRTGRSDFISVGSPQFARSIPGAHTIVYSQSADAIVVAGYIYLHVGDLRPTTISAYRQTIPPEWNNVTQFVNVSSVPEATWSIKSTLVARFPPVRYGSAAQLLYDPRSDIDALFIFGGVIETSISDAMWVVQSSGFSNGNTPYKWNILRNFGNWPSAVVFHTSVKLTNTTMVVIGGLTNIDTQRKSTGELRQSECNSGVWEFNSVSRKWTNHTTAYAQTPSYFLQSAVKYGDNIIVFGGQSCDR